MKVSTVMSLSNSQLSKLRGKWSDLTYSPPISLDQIPFDKKILTKKEKEILRMYLGANCFSTYEYLPDF